MVEHFHEVYKIQLAFPPTLSLTGSAIYLSLFLVKINSHGIHYSTVTSNFVSELRYEVIFLFTCTEQQCFAICIFKMYLTVGTKIQVGLNSKWSSLVVVSHCPEMYGGLMFGLTE